jgi:hypothetical protein
MIAALAADEFERAGVAAFHPAVDYAGRLAPEVGGARRILHCGAWGSIAGSPDDGAAACAESRLVEAYPEQVAGREPQRGAYLHTGPQTLFEEFGFVRDRRIAKWRWIMRLRISA